MYLQPTKYLAGLIGALFLFSGCGATPFFSAGAGTPLLIVSPASTSLSVGGSQKFTVSGGTPPYAFSVSDSTLGAVTADGLLSTIWKPGTARLTVTDSGRQQAQATVAISQGVVALGSGGTVNVNFALSDTQGNRIVIGGATGNLGGRVYGTVSNTIFGVFVSKLNSEGAVSWVTQVSSGSGEGEEIWATFTDATDAIFVVGRTYGILPGNQYGTGHATFSSTYGDAYLLKLSSDGSLAFLAQLGPGSDGDLYPGFPRQDASGNTYFSATGFGDVGGSKDSPPIDLIVDQQAFLFKIAPDGTLSWAEQMGGGGGGGHPWLFSDGVYVKPDGTLYEYGKAFNLGFGVPNLGGNFVGTAGNASTYYVACFNSSGIQQWATQIELGNTGSTSSSFAFDIAKDASNGVYVLPQSSNDLGGPHYGPAGGAIDSGVVKLDSTGGLIYIGQIGGGVGSYNQISNFIQDGTGALYLVGTSTGNVGGTAVGGGLGATNTFLMKLDPAGGLTWLTELGGGAATSTTALLDSFAASPSGNSLLLVGSTTGTVGTQLGAHGATDAFVASFSTAGALEWIDQLGGGGASNTQSYSQTGAPTFDFLTRTGANIAYQTDALYFTGSSEGTLGGLSSGIPGGTATDFVAKFSYSGGLAWVNQFSVGAGSTLSQHPLITVDGSGQVFMADSTNASLPGVLPSSHGTDVFVIKLNSSGEWQ